jgi:hypothetical protein
VNISTPGNGAWDGLAVSGFTVGKTRLLLVNQKTTPSQNGVWIWQGAANALSRPSPPDPFATTATLDYATVVPVTGGPNGGLTWGGSEWWMNTPISGTTKVDTDSLTFIRKNARPVQARVASPGNVTISGPGLFIDSRTVTDGMMTTGASSTTLTCPVSAPFTSADVGKTIKVNGAGSGGTNLVTTIQGYTSPSVVTLTAGCATSVTTVVTDGAMTAGASATTLTCSTSHPFSSGDVGKTIVVAGAGAGGRNLVTTIASFTSSSVVTLAIGCSTTVTGATVQYGTTTVQYAVTLNAGDVVLLLGQTSGNLAADNGLYFWNGSGNAMTRTADPVYPDIEVLVSEGTTLALSRHKLATKGTIILGTTALTFSRQDFVVNVLDFAGVDPTGTNDSTTGLKNAISAFVSLASILSPNADSGVAPELFFPAGLYLISSPLVISGIIGGRITGAGFNQTFLYEYTGQPLSGALGMLVLQNCQNTTVENIHVTSYTHGATLSGASGTNSVTLNSYTGTVNIGQKVGLLDHTNNAYGELLTVKTVTGTGNTTITFTTNLLNTYVSGDLFCFGPLAGITIYSDQTIAGAQTSTGNKIRSCTSGNNGGQQTLFGFAVTCKGGGPMLLAATATGGVSTSLTVNDAGQAFAGEVLNVWDLYNGQNGEQVTIGPAGPSLNVIPLTAAVANTHTYTTKNLIFLWNTSDVNNNQHVFADCAATNCMLGGFFIDGLNALNQRLIRPAVSGLCLSGVFAPRGGSARIDSADFSFQGWDLVIGGAQEHPWIVQGTTESHSGLVQSNAAWGLQALYLKFLGYDKKGGPNAGTKAIDVTGYLVKLQMSDSNIDCSGDWSVVDLLAGTLLNTVESGFFNVSRSRASTTSITLDGLGMVQDGGCLFTVNSLTTSLSQGATVLSVGTRSGANSFTAGQIDASGTLALGTQAATAVTVGRSGITTTVAGTEVDFTASATIQARLINGYLTFQPTDFFVQGLNGLHMTAGSGRAELSSSTGGDHLLRAPTGYQFFDTVALGKYNETQTASIDNNVSNFRLYPSTDGTGSIGLSTARWGLIRGVTVTSGDLHLEDPERGCDWLLREEPSFILAVNTRTGERRKVLTAPLDDNDEQELAEHDPRWARTETNSPRSRVNEGHGVAGQQEEMELP